MRSVALSQINRVLTVIKCRARSLKSWKASALLKDCSSLGMAQLMGRVARLVAGMVAARCLFPEDYGWAAIVLTVNELIFSWSRGGFTARIIQATNDELESTCNSTHFLNRLVCSAFLLLQVIVGYAVSVFYDHSVLFIAIAGLSVTYLLTPFSMVHEGLCLRNKKIKPLMLAECSQSIVDAVLTIGFALAGFGFWSLVLPKLLVVPLWIGSFRRAIHWQPTKSVCVDNWRAHLTFVRKIVSIDGLITIRGYIDYLIIGVLLGPAALGIYFFAFNAGVGITKSLMQSINGALFPHFSRSLSVRDQKDKFIQAIKLCALIFVPMILVQSSLASIYIPIVFGEHWVQTDAVTLVAITCLAILFSPFCEVASQLMRARKQLQIELKFQGLQACVVALSVVITAQYGIVAVAVGLLISQWTLQLSYVAYTWMTCFQSSEFKQGCGLNMPTKDLTSTNQHPISLPSHAEASS